MTELQDTINDFECEFKKQIDDFNLAKAKLVDVVKDNLGKVVAAVLSKSNKIDNISWTGYTPYFNDGEECLFSTTFGDFEVNIDPHEQYPAGTATFLDKEAYDWSKTPSRFPNPEYDLHEVAVMAELNKVLAPLNNNDLLKDIFGDHVWVTVSKSGVVNVKEYEHD